ncbi:Ger(x)C family spore germination protein [Cohnella cholangitidis]|nr:Ger(x)C family spore germination protein [Cohnella cholangitidis]
MKPSRKALIAALFAACLGLSGCWDRQEMDELALVMASGVDLAEDGQIEVTLQIAVPTGIPGTLQSGGKKKPVDVISAKGANAFEIISILQQRLSRRLFFGHRAVFVIGEAFARQSVDQTLDALIRLPDSRHNCYILTTQGTTAKEILNTPYSMESIPAIGMKNIQSGDFSLDVKIDEFIADLAIEGKMPVTGAISLVPSGNETAFQIDKVAVYRNTMLVGYLSGTDLKAFKMIKDGSKNITITQKVEAKRLKTKGTATVEILKGKARLRASMRNGTPHYEVFYYATARMTNNDSTLDFSRPRKLLQLESELSDMIRSAIERMLRKLQREFKSDALGFGTTFHRQYPQQWKHLKRQWNEIYPGVQVDVKARITIERMGRTEAPGPIESAETH